MSDKPPPRLSGKACHKKTCSDGSLQAVDLRQFQACPYIPSRVHRSRCPEKRCRILGSNGIPLLSGFSSQGNFII